jgi:hypothetical protein
MEDQENLTTTEEKRKGENLAPCPPFLRGGESFHRLGPTHYTEVKTALGLRV